jgi:hypothetical protein
VKDAEDDDPEAAAEEEDEAADIANGQAVGFSALASESEAEEDTVNGTHEDALGEVGPSLLLCQGAC